MHRGVLPHDIHRAAAAESDDAGYVLTCICGWRSRPHHHADALGDEWEQHRRDGATCQAV